MMDPALGKKTCYVQFPQRFDGIDLHDRYANRNIVFFDVCQYRSLIPFGVSFYVMLFYSQRLQTAAFLFVFLYILQINLKGLDGIQGPVYVGTGCCFNRQALYGYDPVLTEEDLEPNIIIKSCCGTRKKDKSSNKKYIDKKRAAKRTESTIPIFNMEDIEEGVEGWFFLKVTSLQNLIICEVVICIRLKFQQCVLPMYHGNSLITWNFFLVIVIVLVRYLGYYK